MRILRTKFRLQALLRRLPNDEAFAAEVHLGLADLDRRQETLDGQALDRLDHRVQLALQDEYFVKRNLYPNVDFYSGAPPGRCAAP